MKTLYQFLFNIFLTCFIGVAFSNGQTCSLANNDTLICSGTSVNFILTTSGGTPTSYVWSFGDGFTASTPVAAHVYTAPGVYIPSVVISYVGGATCTATAKSIKVFANPIAQFVITTQDTMCFKNNRLCIQDNSTNGPSNAPIEKRVFQLNNGYLQIDNAPYSNSICYENAINTGGFLYSLVIEVTDTNNCVSRLQKTDSVLLYRQRPPLSYQANYSKTCFNPLVFFNNTTPSPPSAISKFYWVFGDGEKDSLGWLGMSHQYNSRGPFLSSLISIDNDGCKDTAKLNDTIAGILIDPLIYVNGPNTRCFKGNDIGVAQLNDAIYPCNWTVFNDQNKVVAFSDLTGFNFSVSTCGQYRVHLKVTFPDCVIETDTFIQILGPKSIIQNPFDSINRVQNTNTCEVFDTIRFKTPVAYLSCSYGNGAMQHFWNFDDAFAPNCTTDTKNGINVGLNCNFSIDSMLVRHAYMPGQNQCYKPSLYLKDPITGCEHSDTLKLALMEPDASPNLLANPPRRGLFVTDSFVCLGTSVTFNFKETLPYCGYQKAWINLDSACNPNKWQLVDTVGLGLYTDVYSNVCDSNGLVTVGLVLQNGSDKFGNPCFDTAWYHHILRITDVNPAVIVTLLNSCAPFHVKFTPVDSIQNDLVKMRWLFTRNPADTITQNFAGNDSIIYGQQFTFNKHGDYKVTTILNNTYDCLELGFTEFSVGYWPRIIFTNNKVCLGDSVLVKDYIFYHNYSIYNFNTMEYLDTVDYWARPDRAAAGKEKIWWDAGDGKGFVHTGHYPKFKYDKPGNYFITMVTQDSTGCLDTVKAIIPIMVFQLDANIKGLQTAYFCAPQIVLFKDSSFVFDSDTATITSTQDSIVSWQWNFGDNTLDAVLKNPAHNFTSNGKFNINLRVTAASGCSDTASAWVDMIGPMPSFNIEDTLGCEPFTAPFTNTTNNQLINWTWYFGDVTNQTYTTTKDTNVSFTYTKAGVYSVQLLGTQNVFNTTTGNTIICNSFFPNQQTGLPERKVYVMATPQLSLLAVDTVCIDDEVEFVATGDSLYATFQWNYGDGNIQTTIRPDTITKHVFDALGNYKVVVAPTLTNGYSCIDTATLTIAVISPFADFTIDDSQTPNYQFTNTSIAANRYSWNFGKPSSGSINETTTENAAFNFGSDTGTYQVCLLAFNAFDCLDSICKPVRIEKTRIIIPNVFTPDNADGKNDAFDIDILGYTQYNLNIYNRWGALVFSGSKDGMGNDGMNWNGKTFNDGELCPAGVYYFIFTYKLITDLTETTVHGTVTLIRDK